jgi:CRISPR-associated protein (TIGR03986 family)
MSTPTRIDAPYNFVPLSDKVVEADWYAQTSQDLPFRDGFSGEITFTLTNTTPLLVGGKQQAATKESAGKVDFFQTPTQEYAIPGSSLRGMIRNIFEIATFSKMSMLDDMRYGLRDISGGRVKASYGSKVGSEPVKGMLTSKVSAGFLRRNKDDNYVITPHQMVHVNHDDLDKVYDAGLRSAISKANKGKMSVSEKYHIFRNHKVNEIIFDTHDVTVDIRGSGMALRREATNLRNGRLKGRLVLTGQPSKNKIRDFIFYSPSQETISVPPSSWKDFLFIHDTGEKDAPWSYWQEQLNQGKDIPVFYVEMGNILKIGLAYMPKLAGDFTVHDLVKHTSEAHLDDDIHDMANTFFGHVGDKPEQTLKSRVFFETAIAINKPTLAKASEPTILNSPKASYFPNYLVQPEAPKGSNKLSDGKQYATYMKHSTNSKPQIRGFKRYPVRPANEVIVQKLDDEQQKNKAVQVVLHPIEIGAQFSGRIVVHNAKPEEIGALLWSLKLSTEDNDQLCHRLGMGKSFGYGQVQLKNIQCRLTPNDPSKKTPERSAFIDAFTQYMDKKLVKTKWLHSEQVLTLTAMADPSKASQFNGKLSHMRLTMSDNPFNDAKKEGLVLAAYPQSKPPAVSIATQKDQWLGATIEFQSNPKELRAKLDGKIAKTNDNTLIGQIPKILAKLKKKRPVKTDIEYELKGNQYIIIGIEDIAE